MENFLWVLVWLSETGLSISGIFRFLLQCCRVPWDFVGHTCRRVHLQRFLCRKLTLGRQLSLEPSVLWGPFSLALLRAIQSVGYKAIQSAVKIRIDESINEKHSTFHCSRLRKSAENGDFFFEHLWFGRGLLEEWFSHESCGTTPFCEALGFVGVSFLADFSSVNSPRRFGCRGFDRKLGRLRILFQVHRYCHPTVRYSPLDW